MPSSLFEQEPIQLLPYDGLATYHPEFIPPSQQKKLYEVLFTKIKWQQDEVLLFGKKILTKRKVAWYGTKVFNYTYSNITKKAIPFTRELKVLQQRLSDEHNIEYNSCLLNLYHNGKEGVSWHSDAEKELNVAAGVASISLGAPRKFVFKHKSTQKKIKIILEPGSLLLMQGSIQKNWLHSLPKTARVNSPRINLTFRKINTY